MARGRAAEQVEEEEAVAFVDEDRAPVVASCDDVVDLACRLRPYQATLDATTLSGGAHTLMAIARDTAGNETTSQITVTV